MIDEFPIDEEMKRRILDHILKAHGNTIDYHVNNMSKLHGKGNDDGYKDELRSVAQDAVIDAYANFNSTHPEGLKSYVSKAISSKLKDHATRSSGMKPSIAQEAREAMKTKKMAEAKAPVAEPEIVAPTTEIKKP